MEALPPPRLGDDLYSWPDATWQAVEGWQLTVPARWSVPIFPILAAVVGMLQIVWSVWVWRNVAVRNLWLGLGSAVVVTALPCLFTRWRWTRWALACAFALGAAYSYLVLRTGWAVVLGFFAFCAAQDATDRLDLGRYGIRFLDQLAWLPSRVPTRYPPASVSPEPAAELPEVAEGADDLLVRLSARARRLRARAGARRRSASPATACAGARSSTPRARWW